MLTEATVENITITSICAKKFFKKILNPEFSFNDKITCDSISPQIFQQIAFKDVFEKDIFYR